MRVIMIAPEPFLEPRGTPISVYQRAEALASLGHTVDLLTYHVGRDVSIPGVTLHRIPRVPFINEVPVGPSWHKPLLDLLLLIKAMGFLLRRHYDVIHSHEEAAFFCLFLASVFRTRHLYDMHSSLPRQLMNSRFGRHSLLVKLFRLLERKVIDSCDGVITIGSDLAEHVRHINALKQHVMIENLPVHHSSDIRDDALGELEKRLDIQGSFPVVYTGTLEHYQGIELLIEAAAIVRDREARVSFLIAGGKPQQVERWRREAEARGVGDRIRFTGAVPMDEVSDYVRLAEILISPRIEGMSVPLKIYTYLQSGKPIVATNIACHSMVLSGDTALLVEPTGEALAVGILRLVNDPSLRRNLAQEAMRFASGRFSRQSYLEKLGGIYRALQRSEQVVTERTKAENVL